MNEMHAAKAERTKRVSLKSQAYETLKRRILNCELKPGAAVTVADLAVDLGMGRMPVLQAVERLTLDGLVEVMPRKGVVVSPVSLDDLVEINEVRLLNEVQAARWAAERATKTQIQALRTNLTRMKEALSARDVADMIALDSEFHALISEAAGNSILAELLANLHDRSQRFWTLSLKVPGHNDLVCEQHAMIIDAIATGDPDKAETAIRDHINAFQSNIVDEVLRR